MWVLYQCLSSLNRNKPLMRHQTKKMWGQHLLYIQKYFSRMGPHVFYTLHLFLWMKSRDQSISRMKSLLLWSGKHRYCWKPSGYKALKEGAADPHWAAQQLELVHGQRQEDCGKKRCSEDWKRMCQHAFPDSGTALAHKMWVWLTGGEKQGNNMKRVCIPLSRSQHPGGETEAKGYCPQCCAQSCFPLILYKSMSLFISLLLVLSPQSNFFTC